MSLQALLIINTALLAVLALLVLLLMLRRREGAGQEELGVRHGEVMGSLKALSEVMQQGLADLRRESAEAALHTRQELSATLEKVSQSLTAAVGELNQAQNQRLSQVTGELAKIGQSNEARQERLREAVEGRLDQMRADNSAKLEQMRQTVDEKLQGTLEKRLGESFGLVSRQLEQVYKSVGEMQSLASGVGDLKRVLSNVKARGVWGEIQLGNLLAEVLTPQQYCTNAEIRPRSGQRVEFAIRLPGRDADDGEVLLPIDAKFPTEDYERLVEASERADPAAEEAACKALENRIIAAAKDINAKYISPPHSTDFAIMFLPTEGLYAEVLRRIGLSETLQREHRVVVAGPTTLTAILNSLQMGFRSLAIEKRSSEVWRVLGAVKTEFAKYGEVLDKVKKKLSEARSHIDQVGVRTRAIDRKLRDVQQLPEGESSNMLSLDQTLSLPPSTEDQDQ